MVSVSACGAISPAATQTPVPSPLASVLTVAPATIDPFVANFLASNNWTFDLQEAPADVAISAARAIEIVTSRTKGPIKKADAVFGVLHANLGAIGPPRAWLVVLVGPGFAAATPALPTGSPNAAAASFAQAQNLYFVYAFVEATGGSLLMAGGSSPPP